MAGAHFIRRVSAVTIWSLSGEHRTWRGHFKTVAIDPQRTFLVLPAGQMIFHVIDDLLTDRRQLKHLVLDGRIIGLLG
jgi:hypothetical protein